MYARRVMRETVRTMVRRWSTKTESRWQEKVDVSIIAKCLGNAKMQRRFVFELFDNAQRETFAGIRNH